MVYVFLQTCKGVIVPVDAGESQGRAVSVPTMCLTPLLMGFFSETGACSLSYASESWWPSCFCPTSQAQGRYEAMPGFSHRCWHLNSGPHICVTNTSAHWSVSPASLLCLWQFLNSLFECSLVSTAHMWFLPILDFFSLAFSSGVFGLWTLCDFSWFFHLGIMLFYIPSVSNPKNH